MIVLGVYGIVKPVPVFHDDCPWCYAPFSHLNRLSPFWLEYQMAKEVYVHCRPVAKARNQTSRLVLSPRSVTHTVALPVRTSLRGCGFAS